MWEGKLDPYLKKHHQTNQTHTKNQQSQEKLYKILNNAWWGSIFSLNWGIVDLH